ncbi:bacteriophage protein [Escherichia coli]|uniref:Bacteriophage protein n=1 Tax=Escherichia coli TaxID=562 RepID=A0A2X3LYC9_ECOLX|nr:bacteriophage protein [Escherichia coli]
MTQNYELIVKGIRNFENKVTVTLALRDKKRFDGEIFDLDISLDRVEGAALEFYEAAARRSIRQVFLDVAAGLCEEDELLPETRPCSEARNTIKLTVLITRLRVVSFLQLAFQYLSLVAS